MIMVMSPCIDNYYSHYSYYTEIHIAIHLLINTVAAHTTSQYSTHKQLTAALKLANYGAAIATLRLL